MSVHKFVTENETTKEIMRGLSLSGSLYVSSIIIGEPYTGKKSMIKKLFPDITSIEVNSNADIDEIAETLKEHNELAIFNFHKISSASKLDFGNKRIIATADRVPNGNIIDDKFAFIYYMPPLSERPEDVTLYCKIFAEEAKRYLMLEESPVTIDPQSVDISDNIKSLRADIFKRIFSESLNKNDIMHILESFFEDETRLMKGYRENLALLEIPLLKAGIRTFGSQLQLSKALGINRNTLRKKLNEYGID